MYGVLGAEITRGAAGAAVTAGALPFTGLSVLWWLLLGATLMLIGASLLRTSHVLGRARRGERPESVPVSHRGRT
jgi:hypothetical protein